MLFDQCNLRFIGGVPEPAEYLNDAGTYACGQERAAGLWLNRADVRKAIHVEPASAIGDFGFSTGLNYTFTAYDLVPLYASTLLKNFRVLQYSGDADPCVPYVGTERWIQSLNLSIATPWSPWSVPQQGVAGYSTVYEIPEAKHGFTFATVRTFCCCIFLLYWELSGVLLAHLVTLLCSSACSCF